LKEAHSLLISEMMYQIIHSSLFIVMAFNADIIALNRERGAASTTLDYYLDLALSSKWTLQEVTN
jgi:hypothetical protein